MRKITALLVFLLVLPLCAQAQKEKHPFRFNPRLNLLNLFFNKLSGQCELQKGHSALNLQGNLSFAKGQEGYTAGLSYRYYTKTKFSSMFIGAIAHLSYYKTAYEGTVAESGTTTTPINTATSFTLLGNTLTAGANIGFRQRILGIFNLMGRIGYGIPIQLEDLSWQDGLTPTDSQSFKSSYLLKRGIDAELSFGWCFGGRN